MGSNLYESFRQAVETPDERIDLAHAALTLAQSDYPDLDVAFYLSRINQLALAVSERLGNATNPYRSIAALNTILFQEQGFHGNRDDYFDPKNSFLNEVIERKRGIPITLSVLYMEVGRRIGLPLHGVGFPGHFLVKYSDAQDEIVIDPFNRGEVRSTESLRRLLQELFGGRVAFQANLLDPVTKRQILKRMLNNLKVIYLRGNDLLKSLSVLERLVILEPMSAEDLRDRGVVYLKLECFKQALEDFESYLRLAPEADDAAAVRERMIDLTKQVMQIH